jgi:hypothetical protein
MGKPCKACLVGACYLIMLRKYRSFLDYSLQLVINLIISTSELLQLQQRLCLAFYILYHASQVKETYQPSMNALLMCELKTASPYFVRYTSTDDCWIIVIWLQTRLLPHSQHPLSHLVPALENYNIPACQVFVCWLWVGGETIGRLTSTMRTWSSCLVGEFCNS